MNHGIVHEFAYSKLCFPEVQWQQIILNHKQIIFRKCIEPVSPGVEPRSCMYLFTTEKRRCELCFLTVICFPILNRLHCAA